MTSLLAALTILLTGALCSQLAGHRSLLATRCAIAASVAGALFAAGAAVDVLRSGETVTASYPWPVPAGDFVLRIDPLSAFFILPVALLAPLCAIYASAYLKEDARSRPLAPHWSIFCLLTAALLLVVTAGNALLFLAALEVMTLGSFFLIAYDHRQAEVRKAAWVYLIAGHFGLIFLLAFFLLAGSRCASLNFADFSPLAQLSAGAAAPLYLLALAGFAIKAGLFPLHIWLPDAHPAAPSHVSALMSGVVVNTGIYGTLRVLTLLPPAPKLCGAILLVLGMLGALYGIAMAALQQDIKRCLAYSTIENIGIIFVGIGLGILAAAYQLPLIAALAFAGALLHTWNHTLFKGLLFLGAGALYHATGTRSLDRMGGLLRRMPASGALIIGGCVAISALPPFNGFVGEWLIYLGLLQSGTSFSGIGALGFAILFVLLGIVGTLAVVTFTRLAGIALLGEPRSDAANRAHEAEGAMLWPMRLLLLACLFIGLLPQLALDLAMPALAQLTALPAPELAAALAAPGRVGLWGIVLLAVALLFWASLAQLRRRRPASTAATWGCGYASPTPRMAYTAEGYGEFVHNHLLPAMLRPEVRTLRPLRLFPGPAHLSQHTEEMLLQRLYLPFFADLAERCVRLRWLQQGKQHLYLLYIFACCGLLMLWSVVDGRGIWSP